jgi:ATP-dependent Lhr-like helicase
MIRYQKEKYSDDEIHSVLNPIVSEWFKTKFKSFSPPQKYAVIDIHRKNNTLISSPTGSGKTLSAFLSILNELVTLAEKDLLEDKIYCVYISPLKALSNDIERNLNRPLKEISKIFKQKYPNKKFDLRVAVRTGDTTSSKKASMVKKPPHILITTPESFAIILSTIKFRQNLTQVDWCIIDEIHALASSKRGVHLSLSLERLQHETNFTRIGLSATVSPLDEVAKFLVGGNINQEDYFSYTQRDCLIVNCQFVKKSDMKVLCPVDNFMTAEVSKLNNQTYKLINDLIQNHNTTLIFTNTRAGTERVIHNLKKRFPKLYSSENVAAHHGSLSKEHRLRTESNLKEGKFKVVVSSTSLELGIDIGSIDLVILLGSPKSVARALQRIGRSGHSLDEVAKGRIIVLDRDDLVECSVLLKAAIEKKIDRIDILFNSLDVLAQHIYGIAINNRIHVDELYEIIKSSYCYNNLSKEKLIEIIRYLAGEYSELEERYVYAKIWFDENTNMIGKRSKLARLIYMTNIGTIPDTTGVTVKLNNEPIGKIDEAFLEKLKKGDIFVLGGDTYVFQYSRGMTAVVSASLGQAPTVPSWFSEQLPLSFDLALEIQKFRKLLSDMYETNKSKDEIVKFVNEYLYVDSMGANAIYEYFKEQSLYSIIPHYKKILVEHYNDGYNKYVIFHTLFGRRVNDVLSRAIAYSISKLDHKDCEIGITDNGFYISTPSSNKLNVKKAFNSIHSYELREIMEIALDKTEILKRRFRHCASRSLMILKQYKGHKKTVGRQQMSSRLLISAVQKISPNFPILKEAKREILEDLMDIKHAQEILNLVEEKKVKLVETHSELPSPFAFNLVLQGYTDILKMEDKFEFLKRMHESILEKINKKESKISLAKIREDIKQKMVDESLKRNELSDDKKLMIRLVNTINGFYSDYKQEIIKVIEERYQDIDDEFYKIIINNQKSIIDDLPKPLGRLLINVAKEQFKEFSYDDFWDKEEESKRIEEELYKEKLKQDFAKVYRKERFDANFFYAGIDFIDNDGDGKYSVEFLTWLRDILSKTIPMIWSTDLVKFLKNKLETEQ